MPAPCLPTRTALSSAIDYYRLLPAGLLPPFPRRREASPNRSFIPNSLAAKTGPCLVAHELSAPSTARSLGFQERHRNGAALVQPGDLLARGRVGLCGPAPVR